MISETNHISVCVCTYKRALFLRRLLEGLGAQDSDGLFSYSIVVADNDYLRSAEPAVLAFSAVSLVPIRYCVEPRQNIARARNKAIENAAGDFVAFIDDDEVPTRNWLLTLFKTCNEYDVDGVLGPVKPYYDEEPPKWIVRGKFYDRRTYPTGFVIDWTKGRTGNVLLRRRILGPGEQVFNPEFLTGEDQDFFHRMIQKGHVFIWCNEAVAYEAVPAVRWKPRFMLKRALLSGAMSVGHPNFGAVDIAKSVCAVAVYTVGLPFALVGGQHTFMKCLIRLFDHIGKLLALIRIKPIREPYVTD
jgi:glycosyltransferase involved in cell wall biosynthesis